MVNFIPASPGKTIFEARGNQNPYLASAEADGKPVRAVAVDKKSSVQKVHKKDIKNQ